MKKLEIYKNDSLMLSLLVEKYEIITYEGSVDVITKCEDVDITYSISKNKDYKIIVEI